MKKSTDEILSWPVETIMEWRAFDAIEAIGDGRLEHVIARAAAAFAGGNLKTDDFAPYLEFAKPDSGLESLLLLKGNSNGK